MTHGLLLYATHALAATIGFGLCALLATAARADLQSRIVRLEAEIEALRTATERVQ